MTKKVKPEQRFSMERDGFFGEYYRAGHNTFPGKCMIAFGGSVGKFLLSQMMAWEFIAAGMDVLILAYHGEPGLPKLLKDQPVDVIEKAALWLKAQGYEKIGLWGVSMGGCLALLAGSLLPELISCVVASAPMEMVPQAEDNKCPIPGSAFSFHGKPLPYVRYIPDGRAWKQAFLKESLRRREPCTIALLRAVLKYAEQRTNHYIAFTLLAIIRDKVFQALRRLCPAKLEGRDKGDLISLITSDVELLEVFYAHTISPICIAFLVELVMVLFIGSFHWSLGVLALIAFLSVGVALPVIISRRSGTLGDELRAENGALAAYMLESIRGLDESIQYGGGKARLQGLTDKTNALSEKQGKLNRLTGVNLALANTFILVFDAAMLALCAFLYTQKLVGFDGFLIPLLALMSSFGPVTALASLGTTLQATVASGARVLAVIDEKPETEDIIGQEEIEFHGAEVKDLSFSYGSEPVLEDLTLSFPEGKIVGIVGKSGCGKSTLLKLLMRFWRVQKGQVSLSGRSVENINTQNLRDMESYMTQETQLFKDTIAGNLRVAKLDATDEEIHQACKKASIHEFIMTLPKGYDTPVGELGDTLSGGERQRIGLARAFLHGAPFLLLDESTSNLDSLNEAVILKSLKEEAKGKTVVLVSHRVSTVRIADTVIEMENGRVS